MSEEPSCRPSKELLRGLRLLQEKWLLLIIDSLMEGPIGFNELSRKAQGLNSATLAQRLSLLEEVGIVTKTVHSTMPPKTSYQLTEAGCAIEAILRSIECWSRQYLNDDMKCPNAAAECDESA
ncbi:MAG: helix-turn-helix transcriptional regulator [Armatimonadetes bacterium]|nr:helix-turn-helix transcriptional regulator [Armatimonadota bacterium]